MRTRLNSGGSPRGNTCLREQASGGTGTPSPGGQHQPWNPQGTASTRSPAAPRVAPWGETPPDPAACAVGRAPAPKPGWGAQPRGGAGWPGSCLCLRRGRTWARAARGANACATGAEHETNGGDAPPAPPGTGARPGLPREQQQQPHAAQPAPGTFGPMEPGASPRAQGMEAPWMQWAQGSAPPAPPAMPVPAARSTAGNLCSGLCSAPSLGSCSDFPSHCPGAAPRWLRGVGWILCGARGCPCQAPTGGSGAEGHPWVPGQGSHPPCWGSPRAERSQKLVLGCHKHLAKSNTSLEHRPSKSHLRTRLPSSGARAGSPPPRGAPLTLSPLGDPPFPSTASCQPRSSAGPGVPGEAGVQIRRANRSRFLQEPLPALLPEPWTLSHPPRWQGCCQPRWLARGGGREKQSLGHGWTGCDGDSGAAGWALHGSPSSQPWPQRSRQPLLGAAQPCELV